MRQTRGDTPVSSVRLSELFTGPDRAFTIYHFLYGKKQTSPCPMCTMWIDGFNGVAHPQLAYAAHPREETATSR
jgi:predicted dithiol-disulfide oxidoreductase (DUF899 family)